MTYRDRLHAAVKGKPVDRVPFDLAGTVHTSVFSDKTMARLLEKLGIPADDSNGFERVLKIFDIDTRRVGTLFEPESPYAKSGDGWYIDCWGVKRKFTGIYWDIVESPLKDASEADLDSFIWPDAARIDKKLIENIREKAKRLYYDTPYVVCAEHPVYGVMEIGCWMFGFEDFLYRLAAEPELVHKFFSRVLQYQMDVIDLYYGAIGEYIHVTTSGDDFGTQTGPFISVKMFDALIKPYLKKRISYTRQFTKAYYFQHSCGSVFELIPSLIDAGVDILNPIQPGARDMEPSKLKAAYGGRIAFWGGMDTQHLLNHGTPDEVKAAVKSIIDDMEGTGYILAPAHNIQEDVPAENIIAMYEGAKEYYNM